MSRRPLCLALRPGPCEAIAHVFAANAATTTPRACDLGDGIFDVGGRRACFAHAMRAAEGLTVQWQEAEMGLPK